MSVFALRPHPLPLAADMICEQPLIGLGETLQHPPKGGLLVAFLDWWCDSNLPGGWLQELSDLPGLQA